MPDNPTPDMLKRMKVDAPSTVVTNAEKGKARAVTVEEAGEEDGDMNFAPGGDADYFAEEDEEGRFYGGGLTQEQKQILNIFDSATGEGLPEEVSAAPFLSFYTDLHRLLQPEELSVTSIRRILLKFERAVNKNTDQRSKYPDDPTKCALDTLLFTLVLINRSP